ncbi:hypothetical protein GCM10027160_32260 [Streptomyces calidiresistens]|uniref:DUF2178 domain-containing protein n=1 Tax=Streptomyces calidiresistens TaxID=1485586 RepID=A0A7W3T1W4_9ACTN|nr:hypothetical protein [Streptomyces calidiresistens]MBB0229410.1 hypothetical protein [Streptomyces calidiresistens]
MAFEERWAWVQGALALGVYAVYAVVVLGRAGDGTPLAEVSYVPTLLVAVGLSIAAGIVSRIAIAAIRPEGSDRKDQRDREIDRFGEYVGQSLVVVGGVAALAMALAEWPHFWIANALYLAFVLSAALGSAARIVAYRRGFHPW